MAQSNETDASRHLPLLLLLFAGSGCSALIYETVWYQLLQLAIGSTSVSLGFLLATFMGGLCIGSLAAAAEVHRAASAAGLRVPGIGHRRKRDAGAFAAAAGQFGLRRRRGARHAGHAAARFYRSGVPVAAHDSDGRVAPRDCTVAEIDAERSLVVRTALRRQHCRRGLRMPAGRILPAAHLQYGDRHVRGGGDQRRGGAGQLRAGGANPSSGERARACERPARPVAHPRWNSALDDLCDHRSFRRDRVGRGSRVDTVARHAARADGLHLLNHPGRVSDRAGVRQRPRLADAAVCPAASGTWVGPGAPDRWDRVDRLDHLHFPALLADQSATHHEPVAHLPTGHGALLCGRFCHPRLLWGASFPLAVAALAEEAAPRIPTRVRRWAASMPPIRWARLLVR